LPRRSAAAQKPEQQWAALAVALLIVLKN
jgi:hypothetical protein